MRVREWVCECVSMRVCVVIECECPCVSVRVCVLGGRARETAACSCGNELPAEVMLRH
jgi:hypothetical protein